MHLNKEKLWKRNWFLRTGIAGHEDGGKIKRNKYYDFVATAVVIVIVIVIVIIQPLWIILGEEMRSLHYHNTTKIIIRRKPIKVFNGFLT